MLLLYIVLAIIAGTVSAICVGADDWVANRSAVLVAFGIQGAAILTRLGRGHPVSDVGHLTLEQLAKLNAAVERVATEQRNAALVTFAATLCTIGVNSAMYLVHQGRIALALRWPVFAVESIDVWAWRILIFMTAFLIVAAFCHLPSIVLQDIGLIRLQSRFKREGLEASRKKAAKESAARADLMIVLDEINSSLKEQPPKADFGRVIPKSEG